MSLYERLKETFGDLSGYWDRDFSDPNATSMTGDSFLMGAARLGEVQIAKLLISAGANVNYSDEDGWTALHVAAFEGNAEIVKMLLEAGADRSAITVLGRTPLQTAQSGGNFERVRHLL